MISMKEYAESCGLSYEAVRKKVSRYKTELEGHITKQGRVQFLDEFAVDFLEEHRDQQPVVVSDVTQLREMQQIKAEKEELLRENQRLHEAMETLNQKLIKALEREVEQTGQLAEAAAKQLLLEQKELEADTQRKRAEAAEAELNQYQPWAFGLYRKK